MSEALLKSVKDMLNEEKWTRAAISNYSKNNFQEFGTIVEEAKNQNCIDEVKAVCDEYLTHTKNSIIGLYLSGMLSLKKKALDDSNLVTLVNIFLDNHRIPVVVYLCETILAEDENNKFALRTLCNCYKEENNEKVWDLYRHLVRIDHEEADIAKLLAEKYEQEGNIQDAVDNYKKAIHRYINGKTLNQVKAVWTKLVSLIPEEIDFFYLVQRKIAKTFSEDKSTLLMHELYNYYYDNQKWDIAIDILKLILSCDEKDTWARKEIVECYKGKYAKHSQLEEYIRVSNINQNWRNVFEAIADFEKHISFDVKNFVFHRSWGVGKIVKVDGDQLTINFGKKYGVRDMSLKMAIDALQPLKKDHIWVLKATTKKEDLAKKVKDDKTWTLKTIIKSFDNSCDIKRIKLELVPAILSAGEWTSWSNSARKILDSDPTFGVDPNDNSKYVVRDRPITQEEKLANEFKAQKNFFPRIDILMKFVNSDETDTNSELFSEMFGYFVGYLRSFSNVDEEIIAAYLVVRRVVKDNPQLNPGITYSFADLFNELEQKQKREVYEKLKDTKNTQLRRDYLNCIRELLPDWADIYVHLFPCVLEESIITSLVSAGYSDKVKQLAEDCFENYRDNREAVLYFFKECQDEDWFKHSDISYEKQLITLIHILDLSYREISNHYETTENRKIVNRITALLFKNDTLLNYALNQGKNTAERLFTLVDDIQDLDAAVKMNGRNKILEKYPDIKFSETKEKVAAPKGLIVTSKMMEIKKKRLEEIVKVEIPANAKDIAEATAKGDLKENADYSAAKEKQKELGKEASKLEDEIAKATIFNPATVTTTRVSFGTVVTLKNESTGKQEKYTILGPWESDPDNDIISYMSPLGTALQGLTEGAKKTFKIGDNENTVTVISIKAAKF